MNNPLLTKHTPNFHDCLQATLGCFLYRRNLKGEFSHINPSISHTLGASEFQAGWKKHLASNPSAANPHHLQNAPLQYELELYHQRGHPVWLKVVETPVLDAQGQVLHIDGIAWDITPLKNLEQEIKFHKARFTEISECTPIGIFQVDSDDLLVYANTRWQTITGQDHKDTLGHPWWKIIHPEDQEKVFQNWALAEREEQDFFMECRIVLPDESVRWVLLRSRCFTYDKGKVAIGTAEDITVRRQAEERIRLYAIELEQRHNEKDALIEELRRLKTQLELSAKTDPLTGLLNRRGLQEHIEYELSRHSRNKKPFSFIIGDIDHFKKINDSYGHDTGDYVLSEVAKNLQECLRKQDILCRWGGEEFLVLLPDTDLQGGTILAEKLRLRVEKIMFPYTEHAIQATMSLGISTYDKTDTDISSCIKRADECLYEAKKTGRNKAIARQKPNVG